MSIQSFSSWLENKPKLTPDFGASPSAQLRQSVQPQYQSVQPTYTPPPSAKPNNFLSSLVSALSNVNQFRKSPELPDIIGRQIEKIPEPQYKLFGLSTPSPVSVGKPLLKLLTTMVTGTKESRQARDTAEEIRSRRKINQQNGKLAYTGITPQENDYLNKYDEQIATSMAFGSISPMKTGGLTTQTAQKIFGVKPNATAEEINLAYRNLIKEPANYPRTLIDLANRSKANAAKILNQAKELLTKQAPISPMLTLPGGIESPAELAKVSQNKIAEAKALLPQGIGKGIEGTPMGEAIKLEQHGGGLFAKPQPVLEPKINYQKQDITSNAGYERLKVESEGQVRKQSGYNWDAMEKLPYAEQPKTVRELLSPKYDKYKITRMIEDISQPPTTKGVTIPKEQVFYHGTSKAGIENINKSGFVITKGGRNKGMGISISSDEGSASRFATTKGQPFQKRHDIGGVFKLEISPRAKMVSADYFMEVRNSFAEQLQKQGLSVNEAFAKAQISAINQLKGEGVDIIDFRSSLAKYGGEEELRIINPEVIKNHSLVKSQSQPVGAGEVEVPEGKVTEPTPEELEAYQKQTEGEVQKELALEKGNAPYAEEIQKFKRLLRISGEKTSKETGELFREHIPASVFGVSTDEVASSLGMTEPEFMAEMISDIEMVDQGKSTPAIIRRISQKIQKIKDVAEALKLDKNFYKTMSDLDTELATIPSYKKGYVSPSGEVRKTDLKPYRPAETIQAEPTLKTTEKIQAREQTAEAKEADIALKEWQDSYKNETLTSAQLMREAEKSIKNSTNQGVKDRLLIETGRVFIPEMRTPEFVLEKMGLKEKVYEPLKEGQENVSSELSSHVIKANNWWKRIGNNNKARKLASKNIFNFLDGKLADLVPKEKEVALEIKSYLANWADRLGLPEDKRIAEYITHIFEPDFIAARFTFPEEIARILDFITPNKMYDPFLEQRLGAKGYKQDVFDALDAYVYRGSRKLYLDKAFGDIATLVDALPLQASDYVDKLLKNFQGRPDSLEKWIDTNILQGLPPRARQFIGARPEKRLVSLVQRQIFRSTLGLNLGSALKNLTQGVNTFTELGGKYTSIGYLQLAQKGVKELEDNGAMKDIIYAEFGKSSIASAVKNVDTGLFYFFTLAEKINRGAAYYGAKQMYLDLINTRVKEDPSASLIMDEKQLEKNAIEFAKRIVRKTQFAYGKLDTPLLLQSSMGKLAFTLATYPLKQFEFLAGKARKKEWGGIARYIISSLVLVATVGSYLGLDVKSVLFKNVLPGLGIVPSTIKGLLGPEWEREKATKNLIRMLLVPAGGQIKKALSALSGESRTAPSKTYPKGQRRFKIEGMSEVVKTLLGGEWNTEAADKYLIKKGLEKDTIGNLLYIITGDKQYSEKEYGEKQYGEKQYKEKQYK